MRSSHPLPWRRWTRAGLDDLTVVGVGGEAYSPELISKWTTGDGSAASASAPRTFLNVYGPTETTIVTNVSVPLLPGDRMDIGATIGDMAAFVLDTRLNPVPLGVSGRAVSVRSSGDPRLSSSSQA